MNEQNTDNQDQTSDNPPTDEKKKVSGSDFYKSKIAEYQNKFSELERERDDFRLQVEQIKTQQLAEKENYKELWESEKQKRSEAESKAAEISQNYFNGLKMSAIEQEAMKLGINEQALEDLSYLDSSMVQIETTSTGNANVIGAKEFIEILKEKKPYLFKSNSAPNVNNGMPQVAPERTYSGKDLVELQKKDPVKYRQVMKKLYNLA